MCTSASTRLAAATSQIQEAQAADNKIDAKQPTQKVQPDGEIWNKVIGDLLADEEDDRLLDVQIPYSDQTVKERLSSRVQHRINEGFERKGFDQIPIDMENDDQIERVFRTEAKQVFRDASSRLRHDREVAAKFSSFAENAIPPVKKPAGNVSNPIIELEIEPGNKHPTVAVRENSEASQPKSTIDPASPNQISTDLELDGELLGAKLKKEVNFEQELAKAKEGDFYKSCIPGERGITQQKYEAAARMVLNDPQALVAMHKHGITLDEAVAINLYTTSEYANVNEQLRRDYPSEDNLTPEVLQLKRNFENGLSKLPPATGNNKGYVFRGAHLPEAVGSSYKKDTTITATGIMSTSASKGEILNQGINYFVRIKVKKDGESAGRDISMFSAIKSEK